MVDKATSVPLAKLCDQERGITYGIVKVGEFVSGGVPVIRGGDIRNGRIEFDDQKRVSEEVSQQFKRTILKGGEILINLISEPGHTAIVPSWLSGANVSRDVAVIPLNNTVDHRYVDYFLKSPMAINWLTSRLQGSVTQKINLGTLKELPIPTPPIKEQEDIAHILGTLDDKIELNRRMNETLEAIARAIFKSWFVDFDPVRAKASGEAPESICRRLGLTPDLLALFPDRLVDSELGEIPEGWGVLNVAAVTDNIFSGGTPDTRKPEYWNGELGWFSSGETRNRFVVGTEKKITAAGVDNSSTKLAVPGDILIASAGQGNTRGQTSYCAIHTYVNQSVVTVRAKSDAMRPEWLFYNLSRRYEEMRSISDSHSSRGSLTTKLIGGMPIVYPGPDLVKVFGDFVGAPISRQVENQREAEILSGIRDTLLPKLLSGELQVPVAGAA